MAKICDIKDCNSKHLSKGYCMKHYYRAKRGQSLTGKSRFDRRSARVEGNLVYLELANGKGEAIVDVNNKHLEKHNWCLSGDGYAMTWIDGKLVKLHHLVIGKPESGKVTDHNNRNKLDNQINNLRMVTQRENLLNSDISLGWHTGLIREELTWQN